ncbi:hypothetical protein CkaCkLH20_12594 [Colletotrichum karsti]|uniref:Uncharacterized protein n=1 Tax=Colletotrichum karsti TaxID=1095194 RepID=A0A9P6LEY1_9PEZI|nr:uncharacterized protein CkaCkLH20_12594 [Colletotrichum karsti]KAF9869985.1 hypothetical protein CkaCkLH20_12594 [Colletotrichum karsti]
MKYRGVVYDVGLHFEPNTPSVEPFNANLVEHDMRVISNELQANAVRIEGESISRLVTAARAAHALGLTVLFNPWKMHSPAQEIQLDLAEAAQAAEDLRMEGLDIVFVTQCEFTIFNEGIFPGKTLMERVGWMATMGRGSKEQLAALGERSAKLNDVLRSFLDVGKPVFVMEFGCCAYEGAAARGAGGFMLLEGTNPDGTGNFADGVVLTYSETEQADYIETQLGLLTDAAVDGAFVYVFSFPTFRAGEGARNLDMMSFSLVKTWPEGDERYTAMPPWAPKESFRSLESEARQTSKQEDDIDDEILAIENTTSSSNEDGNDLEENPRDETSETEECKERQRFENFEKNSFRSPKFWFQWKGRKAKVSDNKKSLSFLSLPPEIRNEIYHDALVRETSINIGETLVGDKQLLRQYSNRPKRKPVFGSLLRTCKTVHADASAMLYSNGFALDTMQDLAQWLRAIGRNAVHLRGITFLHHIQAASFNLKPRGPKLKLGNQCVHRYASRKVAAMLANSQHLEPLKMQFRYTTVYRNQGLSVPRNDSPEHWVRTARVIAEMVYNDFRPILRQAISRGKSVSEACRLIQVHRGNFEDTDWWTPQGWPLISLNATELKDAEDAVVDHMQLLLRMGV